MKTEEAASINHLARTKRIKRAPGALGAVLH